MPGVTASDFTLHRSDSQMTAQLSMSLAYLERSPVAMAIMQLASDNGVSIGMNPKSADNFPDIGGADPGRTLFDPESNMVVWNPKGAQEIRDSGGNVIGVQSAALGLLHEMVHSIDPVVMAHLLEKIPGYGNLAEYTAIQYESVVATELGEMTRDNHRGKDIESDNSTSHTVATESGVIWAQSNESGTDEYGSYYTSPGQGTDGYVPPFGSTPDPYGGNDYGGSEGGDYGPGTSEGGYADAGSDDAACVAVTSFLPGGMKAGDVMVGTEMQLADENTLEPAIGSVTYSQAKLRNGYRITTESGASLVCSDTAPIPTRKNGLVVPAKLLGEEVPVRWDEAGHSFPNWEKVTTVEFIGKIMVQHITVGDRCFWAGEKEGAYILHHNSKDSGDGAGGDEVPDDYDPLTAGTGNNHLTAGGQHTAIAGVTVQHAAIGQNVLPPQHTAIATAVAMATGQKSGPIGGDLALFAKNGLAVAIHSSAPADQALAHHDAATIVGVPHPVVDHFLT